MNTVLRLCLVGAALLVAAAIGFVPTSHAADRSFAGTYIGSYLFDSSNPAVDDQKGAVTLVIDADGKVTGQFINTTIAEPGKVAGTVSDDGDFKATAEFPDQVYTLKGTVSKSPSGSLQGKLTQYFGGNQALGAVEFDLPRK